MPCCFQEGSGTGVHLFHHSAKSAWWWDNKQQEASPNRNYLVSSWQALRRWKRLTRAAFAMQLLYIAALGQIRANFYIKSVMLSSLLILRIFNNSHVRELNLMKFKQAYIFMEQNRDSQRLFNSGLPFQRLDIQSIRQSKMSMVKLEKQLSISHGNICTVE